MTIENNNTTNDVTETETTGKDDITSVTSELEAVKAELEKNKELLAKVRKFEKENKAAIEAALKEQGKYKELYETELNNRQQIENSLKEKLITDELTRQLTEAKVKSLATALKLIDTKSVKFNEDNTIDINNVAEMVKGLINTDPVLFDSTSGGDQTTVDSTNDRGQKKLPEVKRVSDSTIVGGFEKELAATKSHKEIVEVMKKYGKIS